eukprot:gene26839-35194_t
METTRVFYTVPPRLTLESLLAKGNVENIQPGIVRRMRRTFDTLIIQAVNEQNVDIAVECYNKAVNLPQTKTENDFLAEGIFLTGRNMGSYEYWQHHITEFDIVSKFMLMPFYAATLVPIRRFSEEESSILMSQIGSALVFLHSRGYCFMDVKPSNICLTGNGSMVKRKR